MEIGLIDDLSISLFCKLFRGLILWCPELSGPGSPHLETVLRTRHATLIDPSPQEWPSQGKLFSPLHGHERPKRGPGPPTGHAVPNRDSSDDGRRCSSTAQRDRRPHVLGSRQEPVPGKTRSLQPVFGHHEGVQGPNVCRYFLQKLLLRTP
jgi:hypothetical protein